MANYFDNHDTMTPEVQQALAALPAEARDYLIDLISFTLADTPGMNECWGNEWRSVRTILGGQGRAGGSLEEADPRTRMNHA